MKRFLAFLLAFVLAFSSVGSIEVSATQSVSEDGDNSEDQQQEYLTEKASIDLRNPEVGYSWIWKDETLEVQVYSEDLAMTTVQIGWLPDDTDAASFEEFSEEVIDILSDYDETTGRLVLYGEKISELEEVRGLECLCVRTAVPLEDSDADNDDVWPFIIVEQEIEYNYPCSFPGDNMMLVGENIYIDKYMWSWGRSVEYPYGYEDNAVITDIAISDQYSYVEDAAVEDGIIEIEPTEDGNGWMLHGRDHGEATVTLTIEDWFHESATEYQFRVHSMGEYHILRLHYPEGSDFMFPNDEKEIQTEVIRRYLDENDNHCEESVEDYTLFYDVDGEKVSSHTTDFMTFGISGKTLTVRSEEARDVYESISVRAYNENGECCDTILNMNGVSEYTVVVTDGIEADNVQVGDTIDMSEHVYLYQYKEGQERINLLEDKDNYRVVLEWDERIWAREDEFDDSEAPELRRIHCDGTEIAIIVQEKDEEGNWYEHARHHIWFDDIDCSIWVEELPDGDRDWLYTDEDITYTINTENLSDAVWVDVYVANPDDEGENPLGEDTYTLEKSDGKIELTLHGEAIKEQIGKDDDNFHFFYKVYYKHGDEDIELFDSEWMMWIRDNWADYDLPEHDGWVSLLLGDGYYIPKEAYVYYEDKDHPFGADTYVEVKDLEVLRHRAYKENGAEATGKCIVSVHEDENGWHLEGKDHGETDFRLVFTNVYGEEEEHVFTVSSAGDQIELKLDTHDDRVRVTYDSENRIDAKIVRRYIDSKENQKQEILDGTIEFVIGGEEFTASYEDDFAQYSVDGQTVVIKSKPEVRGENWIEMRATGTFRDNEGNEQDFECGAVYILEVNEEVYRFEFENLDAIDSMVNIGEVVDLRSAGPELWVKRVIDGEVVEEKMPENEQEGIYFSIEDWDENAWTASVKEVDGKPVDDILLLERTGTWETDVWLVARRCENDDEIMRYRFTFSGMETGFRNLRGGDWTWVFEDEGNYRLDLDMNTFASTKDVSVEWIVGNWDEEGNFIKCDDMIGAIIAEDDSQETFDKCMKDSHYVIDKDRTSIHLNGCKLVEDFKNEDNNQIVVQTVIKVNDKEVSRLNTNVELRENYYRLEGEDSSELLHMEGSGWVYDQNTIDAYVECGAYPYGKDVTLYIEDIELHNHDEENPAFTLYTDRASGYWNIYANRPGGATATFTVSHGNIGTFKVEKELHTSNEIYMLHVFSANGSHQLLPGEKMQLVTDFYLYELDENGDVVETYIPEDQYEIKMRADDDSLVSCNPEDGTVKAYKDSMGGTNVHVEVIYIKENGEKVECEFPLWVDVSDYIVTVESEPYFAEPDSIQDIDKFNINIVEKFVDGNGVTFINEYTPDKVKFTDVGNVNYFWITWWQQKLAVNNKITRELPITNCVKVVAEYDDIEFEGWVNVVVCDHEYEKITKTASGKTTTYDYCDKCEHVKNYKTFSLKTTSYTYDGTQKKPAVVVNDKNGNALDSKYYSVTYASGCKNAGTYKVTIKFKGDYSGIETLSFKINAKKITPKVTLSKTTYSYTGKVQKPTVTVKNGNTKLTANTHYTIVWPAGKNVGKHTIKVTLKGNYSGSKSVSYTINPKATSVSKVTGASKAFTVTWKKQSAQVDGYQVQYSTNSKFSSAKTVRVAGASKVSTTVKKLTGKKKYYVRVRTYKKNGTTYYSAWSSAKSVTTKK